MKEDRSKHNKIMVGAALGALILIFIISKCTGSNNQLKQPHDIQNVFQFSALPTTNDCNILIGFGSFTKGIDQHTHRKVVDYIRHHNSIKSIESYANGAEGEHLLCVTTKETADNKAIYKAIRKKLPAFSRKGFTSLEMEGVKKFETKWK